MAISHLHFSGLKVTQIGNRKMVTGIYQPGASGAAGGTHSYTSGGEVVTQAILKAGLGLLEVNFWEFESLLKSDYTDCAQIAFDHAYTASQVGVIHIFQAIPAHLHGFLVKGGTAAATTDVVNIKSLVIGKEEATDRTNAGGASNGGVQNSTAVNVAAEVASTTAYTNYTSRFVAIGR